MKALGTGLSNHLQQEVTTLCFCWKITRSDATSLGFTNHDRDITFDGLTYEASTGFNATAMKSTSDLAVDDMQAEGMLGALSSDKIAEEDLQSGLYDNAAIEIYLVNWENVSQRVLERFGTIGEVQRSGKKFKTEVRGYSHVLQQPFGRLFQRTCPYVVGDSECGFDLSGSTYTGSGTVSTVTNRAQFDVSGLGSYDHQWFTKGILTWTSGNNNGKSVDVRYHGNISSVVSIHILYPMGRDIVVGDTFTIKAGCDNEFSTCKAKFSWQENFGGFPHMPGNDFLVSYPNRGEGHDGSRLVD